MSVSDNSNDNNLGESAERTARFDLLMDLYVDNKATAEEAAELRALVMSGDFEERFKEKVMELGAGIPAGQLDPQIRNRILANILKAPLQSRPAGSAWRWVAAAAVMIIGLSAGFFLIVNDDNAQIASVKPAVIAPGGDKAILQLADGSQVELDSVGIGGIPKQGLTQIVNGAGKISYASSERSEEVLFNKIITPRGGKYQIELSDGSKVWLNAMSSLRYPAAFSGSDRVVELTGEAYFEIAKNSKMPFKVRIPTGSEVEVLGTHFNIMAYGEEPVMKTTLLEGSVKVSSSNVKGAVLAPNQQAQIFGDGKISLLKKFDATQAVAWKNDNFIFDDTELETIMRQVSRWYDVDVVYEGNQNDQEFLKSIQFIGEVSRRESAQEVLNLLKLTGAVDFVVAGRTITVRKQTKK
jgi:transmembrane sensor